MSNLYPGSSGGCRKIDGTFANAGDIEVYYKNCGISLSVPLSGTRTGLLQEERQSRKQMRVFGSRLEDPLSAAPLLERGSGSSRTVNANSSASCAGDVAEIALNFNVGNGQQFASSRCLEAPTYSISSVGNIIWNGDVTATTCDLSNFRELFRVIRGYLDSDGNVVTDSSGILTKIVHRETGTCLAPNVTQNADETWNMVIPLVPLSGPWGPLKFIPCDAYNSGFWWGLIPTLSSTLITPSYGPAPQQLVYLSDVSLLPDISNQAAAWSYFSTNGQAIYESSVDNKVQLYHYTSQIPPPGHLGHDDALAANTQLLNYSLYKLISTNPIDSFPFETTIPV
jgi:hypothetical protein